MIKPTGYLTCIVLVSFAAVGYQFRTRGVFACPAAGYDEGYYLAYCHGGTFGDYDHGAFWYGLEPEASRAASAADVLFLGSSRMQFALSTEATSEWFASRHRRHYLLGFGYTENITFMAPLLAKLAPRARAYVINVDRFFIDVETTPAAEILNGGERTRTKYETKRRWQPPHRWLCGALPSVCGDQVTFLRRPSDGHWRLAGHLQGDIRNVPGSVADGPERDRNSWEAFSALANRFVLELPVDRRCVFLTLAPYRDTRRAEATAIADALGIELLAPQPTGLQTFDGSHLDDASAERWSAAFFEAAGPRIHECLQ
jgi:hypothetical protein